MLAEREAGVYNSDINIFMFCMWQVFFHEHAMVGIVCGIVWGRPYGSFRVVVWSMQSHGKPCKASHSGSNAIVAVAAALATPVRENENCGGCRALLLL